MTTAQYRTLARVATMAGCALNVGVCVGDLVAGWYHSAGAMSIVAVLAAAWLLLLPKLDDWIDAKVAGARIQQDMQQTALDVMREQKRAGNARVSVTGNMGARVN